MLFGNAKGFSLLFVLAFVTPAHAQYELPDEIFQRTLLIRSGNEQATAFKFDQGGHIYLATTRHLGRKLPAVGAVVEVWHNQTWNEIKTVRTLFPASQGVELAILETSELISRPYTVVKTSEVLTTDQKVWIMGSFPPIKWPRLPANMPQTSRPLFPEVPFVTIGTISAIDPTRPDAFEVHFRGVYNVLIAAGPIVYWSPVHKDFEVLGVIVRDESKAVATPVDDVRSEEKTKSGVLRGYSIDLIMDVIRDAPNP